MLDPWIIEEIRRREDERRRDSEAPRIELPLEYPGDSAPPTGDRDEGIPRGVVVIDL